MKVEVVVLGSPSLNSPYGLALSVDVKQHFKKKKRTAVQHLAKLRVTKRHVLGFVPAPKFLRLSKSLSAESPEVPRVYTHAKLKSSYTH